VTPALLAAVREARAAHRAVALVTWLRGGAQRLVDPGGAGGGGSDPISPELAAAVARVLRSDAAEVVADGERGDAFIEPLNPPLRLIVVGAVHITAALAQIARVAGFAVTIVEPRKAWATEARFPGETLVRTWPDEAVRGLAPDARTAVVTLTHDPKLDDPALIAALATPAFYVGSLGSKKTHAARGDRLREVGLDAAAIGRIRGPVGLSIGARSPAEIAVSIVGEIVAVLRGAT
jgi:xanthine dehydrogenase accessory factor